jgi:uncharacterized protein (TIGR00255 family)
MPHSMTGFAAADAVVGPFRLVWEIRSVNHRFLELGFKLPEELRALEPDCRELLGATVKRGKIDCALKITTAEESTGAAELVPEALQALEQLQARVRAVFKDARPLSVAEVLRWPGVLKEPEQSAAVLAEPAKRCFAAAVERLQEARSREGERIAAMLLQRNEMITALVDSVRPALGAVQQRQREKLQERLARLDVQANPERLEQEIALLLQRLDVSEEIDRLGSHVTEVGAVLRRQEPVGRRLDFLIQELNREANTFASKVQDGELARTGVELKVVIEQMREQVQNLE